MRVKVKLHAILRNAIGANEVCLTLKESSTIRDLLKEMRRNYGTKIYQIMKNPSQYIILLNQRSIELLGGLDTPLRNGDTVACIPVLADGRGWRSNAQDYCSSKEMHWL